MTGNTEILKGEFAKEQNHDVYIIPSSIHETLLVPTSSKLTKSAMKQMIKEVNHTQLSKEEWLFENLYYYSRKRRCLELVA